MLEMKQKAKKNQNLILICTKNDKIEIKKDIINKEINKERKESNMNIQMKKEYWENY